MKKKKRSDPGRFYVIARRTLVRRDNPIEDQDLTTRIQQIPTLTPVRSE